MYHICVCMFYVPKKKFLNVVTCINNYLFSFYQHSVHASSVLPTVTSVCTVVVNLWYICYRTKQACDVYSTTSHHNLPRTSDNFK